jgi:hypothetical protein
MSEIRVCFPNLARVLWALFSAPSKKSLKIRLQFTPIWRIIRLINWLNIGSWFKIDPSRFPQSPQNSEMSKLLTSCKWIQWDLSLALVLLHIIASVYLLFMRLSKLINLSFTLSIKRMWGLPFWKDIKRSPIVLKSERRIWKTEDGIFW